MDEKRLKTIEQRLDKLEKAVFGPKPKTAKPKAGKEEYSGLKGGLLFLVSRDFFKTKRALATITKELEKHGYHYQAGAIQTTLNRLSKRSGPLTSLKEGGHKVYVRSK
jgi:hypothetical protein